MDSKLLFYDQFPAGSEGSEGTYSCNELSDWLGPDRTVERSHKANTLAQYLKLISASRELE